ncbi:MAG: hypothetical protein IJO06_11160 [Thermoguttaceae bacterium]|nr:hypothetical protein [Thermoguttaceae bacterium]
MQPRRLLRNIAVSASLAVAATTFGSAVVSVSPLRAEEPQVAASQEFDKKLLEIPDGETTEFYQKRLEVLLAEFRARPAASPAQKGFPFVNLSPERSELAPATATVRLKLADDASPTQPQRDEHFRAALDILSAANDLAALRATVAKEKAAYKASPNDKSAERVAFTEQTIVNRRLVSVLQSLSKRYADRQITRRDPPTLTPEEEAELRSLETELIAKVKAVEIPFQPTDAAQDWADVAVSYLSIFEGLASQIGGSFKKELRDVLADSDDAKRRKTAERLSGEIRREELPGKELKLEGVLADGTELDWESYRGKVVWFQTRSNFGTLAPFASQNDAPQTAKYKELYAKYADAGLAVLEYDAVLKAPEKDVEQLVPEPGYPILSRRLSAAAKKDYVDFAELYSLEYFSQAILIDVDGKVVSVAPNADDLEKLLKERFPNVK